MSRRFTESTKWRDLWFRRLSFRAKLLRFWAWDNCDAAGVIGVDVEMAGFELGVKLASTHIEELKEEIVPIGNEKFWIRNYILQQNGKLSESCPAHKPVIAAVLSHSPPLVYLDGIVSLSNRLPNSLLDREQVIEKGIEMVQVKQGGNAKGGFQPPSPDEAQAEAAKIGMSSTERVKFLAFYTSNGWRVGKNPMKDWRAAMVGWNSRNGHILPGIESAPKPALPEWQTNYDQDNIDHVLAAREFKRAQEAAKANGAQ